MVPLFLGWLLSVSLPTPNPPPTVTADAIASLAPAANREAIELALGAMRCAQKSGVGVDATRLAFIDYSRPSTEPRLWVFDLRGNQLLYEEVVAHGRGSGENIAKVFSNTSGSHASSLGLFLTRETYQGRNGYSLRMDGLEPGINDAAMQRAIVMHGAPYVDPLAAAKQGRLGRSFGCPAVRAAVARGMIDVLKDGQFVFAYYPDSGWLSQSRWKCAG
jgi:L,D-transpeptidase catalytic domain